MQANVDLAVEMVGGGHGRHRFPSSKKPGRQARLVSFGRSWAVAGCVRRIEARKGTSKRGKWVVAGRGILLQVLEAQSSDGGDGGEE